MTTPQIYHRKYFSGSKKFQANRERIEEIADIIESLNPVGDILDVGCGRGFMVQELRNRGFNAKGCDFSPDAIDMSVAPRDTVAVMDARNLELFDDSFDVVMSTDFFEHIAEEDLEKVMKEMTRVGKRVVARVAVEDENSKENMYHVTVKPREWWEEFLGQYGITLI